MTWVETWDLSVVNTQRCRSRSRPLIYLKLWFSKIHDLFLALLHITNRPRLSVLTWSLWVVSIRQKQFRKLGVSQKLRPRKHGPCLVVRFKIPVFKYQYHHHGERFALEPSYWMTPSREVRCVFRFLKCHATMTGWNKHLWKGNLVETTTNQVVCRNWWANIGANKFHLTCVW